MVLDMSGKVQADSRRELNGSRMEVAEVASILSHGEKTAYGVHTLKTEETESLDVLHLIQPFDGRAEWVAYSAAALTHNDRTIGAVLYSAPIQDLM